MKKSIIILLAVVVISFQAFSETLTLKLVTFDNGSHEYYYELLEESLALIGYELDIQELPQLPQTRITQLLKKGEISMHWYVENADRDATYVPVNGKLTNSLIGHRILFIKKGNQAAFNNVKSLDDFRNLGKTGGFGKNWFDVKVWKANNLKYREQSGEWRHLYKMVGSGGRGIDYFSRGVTEILPEYKTHKDYLDIEQNLMLVYDRDFKFYLSKANADKKAILEKALSKAKETGLIDKLVRKHWSEDFKNLDIDNRTIIKLKTE